LQRITYRDSKDGLSVMERPVDPLSRANRSALILWLRKEGKKGAKRYVLTIIHKKLDSISLGSIW
jgi:hypothetical protein